MGIAMIREQDRRPADVFIPNLAGGLNADLDVTVMSPFQEATRAVATGHVLYHRYSMKAEACQREGIALKSICMQNHR